MPRPESEAWLLTVKPKKPQDAAAGLQAVRQDAEDVANRRLAFTTARGTSVEIKNMEHR